MISEIWTKQRLVSHLRSCLFFIMCVDEYDGFKKTLFVIFLKYINWLIAKLFKKEKKAEYYTYISHIVSPCVVRAWGAARSPWNVIEFIYYSFSCVQWPGMPTLGCKLQRFSWVLIILIFHMYYISLCESGILQPTRAQTAFWKLNDLYRCIKKVIHSLWFQEKQCKTVTTH